MTFTHAIRSHSPTLPVSHTPPLLPPPDTGLVSSSLDSTLRMLDLERGVLTHTVNVHKKGVRSFAYSPAFSLVARWDVLCCAVLAVLCSLFYLTRGCLPVMLMSEAVYVEIEGREGCALASLSSLPLFSPPSW